MTFYFECAKCMAKHEGGPPPEDMREDFKCRTCGELADKGYLFVGSHNTFGKAPKK